jgi:hypothetical protein
VAGRYPDRIGVVPALAGNPTSNEPAAVTCRILPSSCLRKIENGKVGVDAGRVGNNAVAERPVGPQGQHP